MDDVEQMEKRELDAYIKVLEDKSLALEIALNNLQKEKEALFEAHVKSLTDIYKIGEKYYVC